MTIALLITTLNAVTGVKKVVPRIKKEWVDEILFVDGGSTDGTIEEAEKMGFKVIIQKQKGLGAAIIEGVNAIKSDNFILFGPDGNDEPEIGMYILEINAVDKLLKMIDISENIKVKSFDIVTYTEKQKLAF